MGVYLKYFETESDFQSFRDSDELLLPNVSLVVDGSVVHYLSHPKNDDINEPIVASVGDIAYWDGSRVNVVSSDKWNETLGTPVGVVAIPSNFLPDGKARIVSMYYVGYKGKASETPDSAVWRPSQTDTSIPNFQYVLTNDNNARSYVYFPSDKFTGEVCLTDQLAKYHTSAEAPLAPSLYNGSVLNEQYTQEISGGNALSDFNGLENSITLSNEPPVEENPYGMPTTVSCDFAKHALAYNDGASNLQWYLPAFGELAVLLARLGVVESSLEIVNGININCSLLSSTEANEYLAWAVRMNTGYAMSINKLMQDAEGMRAFAMIG